MAELLLDAPAVDETLVKINALLLALRVAPVVPLVLPGLAVPFPLVPAVSLPRCRQPVHVIDREAEVCVVRVFCDPAGWELELVGGVCVCAITTAATLKIVAAQVPVQIRVFILDFS